MQLTRQPQLAALPEDPKVVSALQNMYQQTARVINKNLTFGSPAGKPDNMKGSWFDGITPAGVNTDFTVQHNLGYVPQGWLVLYQDKAASIYAGVTVWTKTQIFLRCNTASVHVRLFVIG